MSLLPLLLPLYRIRFEVFGLPTNLIEIAVAVLVVTGLVHAPTRQRWRKKISQLPLTLVIGITLFLAAALLSTEISDELRVSLGILKGWVVVPVIIGFLVYAAAPKERRHFTTALLATGPAVALLSLSQLGTAPRLTGLYDVPASLALWLAPLLAITMWRGFHVPHERHWLWLSLPMLAALLATQSLTAVTALIAALIIGACAWVPAPQRHRLVAGALGLALIASITLTATGKIAYLTAPLRDPDATSSFSVRQQLWSISLDLIKQSPVLGVGLGQFEPAYQNELHQRFLQWEQCQNLENCKIGSSLKIVNWKLEIQTQPLAEFVYRDPHNLLLSLWLNTGLLGLIVFAGVHVIILMNVMPGLTRHPGNLPLDSGSEPGMTGRKKIILISIQSTTRTHQQAIFLALVTLLIAGLAETVYWKNDLAALHWTLLGMLFTYQSKELLLR